MMGFLFFADLMRVAPVGPAAADRHSAILSGLLALARFHKKSPYAWIAAALARWNYDLEVF
jgi:hypothetical protein